MLVDSLVKKMREYNNVHKNIKKFVNSTTLTLKETETLLFNLISVKFTTLELYVYKPLICFARNNYDPLLLPSLDFKYAFNRIIYSINKTRTCDIF